MPSFDNEEHTHPWFIDRDGTIIHIFDATFTGFEATIGKVCPFAYVAFEQNATPGECDSFPFGGVDIFPGGTAPCGTSSSSTALKDRLEFLDPLPDDFSFTSGSISRFEDRLSLFLEEFTPSRVGEPAILTGQDLLPVESFITRYDFINIETLGTSDGGPTQIFTPSGNEIKVPTRGTATVTAGSDTFTVTDDIQTAGPNDTVFEYNEVTGDVLFGNGTSGKIPENGADIVLQISIRNGGGQWEFKGIIVEPKANISLGNVKSVEDTIFYSQSEISMGSSSGFTTVTNKLKTGTVDFYNKKVEDEPPARLLLGRHVIARAKYGMEYLATGGTITLHNTSGFGYVNPHPKAADDITLTVPPFSTIPFQVLEVDTGAVYPSIRATVSDMPTGDIKKELSGHGQFATIAPAQRTHFFQSEDIFSGTITSPKNYDDTITLVGPTAFIWFAFVPGSPTDLSTIDFLLWSISGNTAPIIAPNYDIRLIQMGTKVGDYDNPVDTISTVSAVTFNNSTGAVTPTNTNGNFDSGETWVNAGRYQTTLDFAIGDLSDHLIMKYEGRLTDSRKAVLAHYGSPIPPDFTCEWKFELTNVATFDRPEDPIT